MASVSQYPGGFANGITIRGVPLQILHPGKVFWVNNSSVLAPSGVGGSDGNDGSYTRPFSTLDYAIGKCTADRGDVIVLMPGHAENLGAAAAITSDVAGVAVVGLGSGSKRPKFSWTLATADWNMTAANLSFYNIVFEANIADVTSGIDISGVAGISFSNCDFTEAGADLNWVEVMNIATGASNFSMDSCKFITNDAANDSHIAMVATDGFYLKDCYFAANTAQTSVVGLVYSSGNITNCLIDNCKFRSNIDGALWVDFDGTANGGLITNCYVSSIDTAGATSTGDFTGGHFFECYVSGEANAFGLVGGGGVVYVDA